MDTTPQDENIQRAIDKFWEVIPPLWRGVRKHIHDQAAEDFQITLAQFHIMRHIHSGMDSVSDLAKTGKISRPAISRGVDALVHKGLVNRSTDTQDRRHIQLSLTTEGETLLSELFENTRQWMAIQMISLTEADLKMIQQGIDALQRAFIE
jgi:DNA-binding MarR family transcriptional regulator